MCVSSFVGIAFILSSELSVLYCIPKELVAVSVVCLWPGLVGYFLVCLFVPLFVCLSVCLPLCWFDSVVACLCVCVSCFYKIVLTSGASAL